MSFLGPLSIGDQVNENLTEHKRDFALTESELRDMLDLMQCPHLAVLHFEPKHCDLIRFREQILVEYADLGLLLLTRIKRHQSHQFL